MGGTNPSLIEALSLTDVNLLFDVCFNRDVGGEACLYFYEEGDLRKILNNSKSIDKKRNNLSKKAKDIVYNNYTWNIIVNDYKKIFK